jgi:hypothetical protein
MRLIESPEGKGTSEQANQQRFGVRHDRRIWVFIRGRSV